MESTQGVLFRLAMRTGLLVFAGVLMVAAQQGMDLTLAFFRGLVALLAIALCGWAAERVAGPAATHLPAMPVEEPEAEGGDGASDDESGTRPAAA